MRVEVTILGTLRTPLFGTLLQTLPDLVTPLKGQSISAQLSSDVVSALRTVAGTNMTVEAT